MHYLDSTVSVARPLIDAGDVPLEHIGDSRYEVKFANTASDLDAVLRLRFNVFNLELGEGLAESFDSGRDEDRFDSVCSHLMVVERSSSSVVGTYRLQTSAMAASGFGFYSGTEFDLTPMPADVVNNAVELGRACIAREHRNSRVLFLLWRGLAAYVAHNRKRYLFGCCSLTSQDHLEGARVAAWLEGNGHMHPTVFVRPRADFMCLPAWADASAATVKIPKLFGIYLRYGARACSAPAVDRAFGTIDFLVLADAEPIAVAIE